MDYVDSLSNNYEKESRFTGCLYGQRDEDWLTAEARLLEFGAGRLDQWSRRNFESARWAKTWDAIASILPFDPHGYC